jgi:hypothetical protein
LEAFHEGPADIESKYGGPGAQEGELAEIIVLEQRAEQSQTLVMTQVGKEWTDALVNEDELMISLLCLMRTS